MMTMFGGPMLTVVVFAVVLEFMLLPARPMTPPEALKLLLALESADD